MASKLAAFVVRFSDGLGNQLFQYAFARMHASQGQLQLLYDRSWYSSPRGRTDRPFLLDHYRIAARPWTTEEERLLKPPQAWIAGPMRWLRPIAPLVLRQRLYLEDPNDLLHSCNSWYPEWAVNRGPGFAAGYFASHRYPDSIRETLLRELQPVQEHSAEVMDRAAELETEESVCVCFRRGDYSRLGHFGVLPFSFYTRAFGVIGPRLSNPKFYVFSDEPEAAQKLLAPLGVQNSQWCNARRHSPEKLFLMSRCRHFILANSTFGWWAAWLGQRAQSIIVRPALWFLGLRKPYANLFPPCWRKLPV